MSSSPVIWFCGLSGSGKTTLAKMLNAEIAASGHPVEHLDGDSIRDLLDVREFTRDGRNHHLKRIAHTASLLQKHGVTVIASFISPYKESRDWARAHCPNFVEVYLSTPLAVCEQRDVKGLYKKARAGVLANFTGIDSAFEPPENAELVFDTNTMTTDEVLHCILEYLGKF